MKVTKVDRTRIAVTGQRTDAMGRGILYPTPNAKNTVDTVETQIKNRIDAANKLYGVFFRSDVPRELESHFQELVKIARNSVTATEFKTAAKKYKSYIVMIGDRPKEYLVKKFTYGSANKNIYNSMVNHVRERMTDAWQKAEYCDAAARILTCVCDEEYTKKLDALSEEVLTVFVEASKGAENVYLRENTQDLEKYFTILIKSVCGKIDVSEQIKYLQTAKQLITFVRNKETKKNDKVVIPLSDIRYPYATEERLKALLVRMRKSLKRGSNGEVAILLLQGLAQMDGKTLASVVTDMMSNEKDKAALKKFLCAVNEDYHKNNIVKSIKNHDVKVQLRDDALDLSSANIEKVSSRKKNRAELTETLEKYASSQEASNQVLLDMKAVLLDFFMWKEPDVKAEFLTLDNLWSIPNRTEELFDDEFEPVDPRKSEKMEANIDLFTIFSMEKPKAATIKARINYVNCGKYQQLMKDEQDDFRKYWITFVKDFVEKNYVSKKRYLEAEDCCKTKMLLECWKDATRFLCGKYIDIGKAVFHFAMPDQLLAKEGMECGVLREEFEDGISSFAYEAIKAEETLQRNIATSVVAAAASFTRSVIDNDKHEALLATEGKKDKEDIFFMGDEDFRGCMKEPSVAKKQLLRFYGGSSHVEEEYALDAMVLVHEQRDHLAAIRNENFHYTDGKKKGLETQNTMKLWNSEIRVYQDVVRQTYYSNNTAMFYPQDKLQQLVEKLYQKSQWAEAQIPAFRTVFKRKDLPEYINTMSLSWDKNDSKHVIFEGALYFLLKEIYYHDFILNDKTANYFFAAVDAHDKKVDDDLRADFRNAEKKALRNAGQHFKNYVDQLRRKYDRQELTFGSVCQFINMEHNQQNSGKGEVEIYKHFKILFPMCMKNAFLKYVQENYGFILRPVYTEMKGAPSYLENVQIHCMETNPELAHWFTFAHYIHPRQLNFLIGDIKSYIQYRQDVVRRAGYAGQLEDVADRTREEEMLESRVARATDILNVLDFVRNTSGRVSNEFLDYYESPEEYARYMSNYIAFDMLPGKTAFESLKAFCQNTLPGDAVVDIYADAENPKLLRNVEIARMYAGGDVPLPEYEKVTKEEIIQYYKEKDAIAKIQSRGMCESAQEQQRVTNFQQLKGRITLNEVTDLFGLVNDALGQLVSLSYLRERDEMYLFLGFYYMALRNQEGWTGEILDELQEGKYHVEKGLVLYQTIGLFDFGTKLLCKDSKGAWDMKTGNKYAYFISNHEASYRCIMRLFEAEKYGREIQLLRNYVDHSKYYIKHDKSIMDLYSEFYTKFFGYSSKLRKAVLFNLQNVLEQYFVECALKFEGVTRVVLNDDKTISAKFTYKYQEVQKGKIIIKTVDLPAKRDTFINGMKKLLKYKK